MVSLFTMQGRITRSQYVISTVVLYVAMMVIAFGLGFVLGIAGVSEDGASAVGFIFGTAVAVVQAFLVVRRLHDLGKPGWHYWLFFVPFYNIYLGLVLLFTPGTTSSNEYGPAAATA